MKIMIVEDEYHCTSFKLDLGYFGYHVYSIA